MDVAHGGRDAKIGMETPSRAQDEAYVARQRQERAEQRDNPRNDPALKARYIKANSYIYATIVSTLSER